MSQELIVPRHRRPRPCLAAGITASSCQIVASYQPQSRFCCAYSGLATSRTDRQTESLSIESHKVQEQRDRRPRRVSTPLHPFRQPYAAAKRNLPLAGQQTPFPAIRNHDGLRGSLARSIATRGVQSAQRSKQVSTSHLATARCRAGRGADVREMPQLRPMRATHGAGRLHRVARLATVVHGIMAALCAIRKAIAPVDCFWAGLEDILRTLSE